MTQAQWRALMGTDPSKFKGDELPVEQVSCHDAAKFCRKLTDRERQAGRLPEEYLYRLPTEAAGARRRTSFTATAFVWFWLRLRNDPDYARQRLDQ